MSDLDNELTRTLNRRAENLSAVPLAFDDVRGKATSIRRRRRVVTGLAAAAAVAVIVPTGMFAAQNIDADQKPAPADNTPTVVETNDPTPSEGPTMGADAGALDVADLPTGAPPAWSLVTEGGAGANTEEAAIRWSDGGVFVETAGQTFGPYPSSTGLARNPAGTAVAWGTDVGDVMVWADGSNEPFTISTDFGDSGVEVVAVTGDGCRPGGASDCAYFVTRYNFETNQPESVRLSGDGSVDVVDPDRTIVNVTDVAESGLVIGHTEITDNGSCSAVLDPAGSGSTPLWKTCKHTLASFSPNGDYVLASDAYGDGIGSGQIAVYDARTGELLADRVRSEEGHAFYNSAVWEDETHVLFTAYQDGKWSIVRMDVDGALEYAIAPEKGDEMEVPWHFETR